MSPCLFFTPHLPKPNNMDREQEEMQFLGLFCIYRESYKIILNFRRIFTEITIALILPLSLIFLGQIDISEFLLTKIIRTEHYRDYVREGTFQYAKLSERLSSEWAVFWAIKFVYFVFLIIVSLSSTSAVVYTVASIYTGRDVTFEKVMSVVPKVWKRLMVTFLCAFLVVILCKVFLVLTIILWWFTMKDVHIVGPTFIIVFLIAYAAVLVYMAVVWELANIVSVLEDLKGFKAMIKSRNLLQGKLWIAVVIYLTLRFTTLAIEILFENIAVNPRLSLGVADRIGYGFLCLLMLMKVVLFGLVLQTVIYLVCKSYHHEKIDKSLLSEHLEVYLGEYVPLQAKDVQLEHYDV